MKTIKGEEHPSSHTQFREQMPTSSLELATGVGVSLQAEPRSRGLRVWYDPPKCPHSLESGLVFISPPVIGDLLGDLPCWYKRGNCIWISLDQFPMSVFAVWRNVRNFLVIMCVLRYPLCVRTRISVREHRSLNRGNEGG